MEGGIGPSEPGGIRRAEVGETLDDAGEAPDDRAGDAGRYPPAEDGAVDGEVLDPVAASVEVPGREDEEEDGTLGGEPKRVGIRFSSENLGGARLKGAEESKELLRIDKFAIGASRDWAGLDKSLCGTCAPAISIGSNGAAAFEA